MIDAFKPMARKDDLVTQDLADELLVYDLGTKRAHCLNSTSALVWKFCDGSRSISEITSLLNREFDSDYSDEIIMLAIEQFRSTDLLVSDDGFKIPSLSRREVMRKAGFAIVVALPIISSIAVPSNVAAAGSGLPPGATCASPIDCQSGLCLANNTCA